MFSEDEATEFFKKLGRDAISKRLTFDNFKEIFSKKGQPIKKALLDQKNIAGIGNIYADEILFASRINPLTTSSELTTSQIEKIYVNMKKILADAILAGGTTFSDFKNTSGETGNYYKKLRVYQQNTCITCSTKIKKVNIAGRTSSYCPKCQKAK